LDFLSCFFNKSLFKDFISPKHIKNKIIKNNIPELIDAVCIAFNPPLLGGLIEINY